MVDERIELLKSQLQKLNADGFDAESWRKSTAVVLAKICGSESEDVRSIKRLKADHAGSAFGDVGDLFDSQTGFKNKGAQILRNVILKLESA